MIEARDMQDKRGDACLSVISTVFTRMRLKILSDGTVAGTIIWKCYQDTLACQFPAYSVNGCDGIIPQACPDYYPHDIEYFSEIVKNYLSGKRGNCSDYLFYGMPVDINRNECEIKSDNGYVLWWWEQQDSDLSIVNPLR